MKAIFLSVLICGAALLTGCETVAVVDHSPYYRPGVVYYDSGRPYYYTSGVRYWGYPRGYGGPYRGGYGYGYGGSHYYSREVNRDVTRNNYYVDRRTVYHGNNQRPHTSAATNVHYSNQKYVNQQKSGTNQTYPNKKKKHHDND